MPNARPAPIKERQAAPSATPARTRTGARVIIPLLLAVIVVQMVLVVRLATVPAPGSPTDTMQKNIISYIKTNESKLIDLQRQLIAVTSTLQANERETLENKGAIQRLGAGMMDNHNGLMAVVNGIGKTVEENGGALDRLPGLSEALDRIDARTDSIEKKMASAETKLAESQKSLDKLAEAVAKLHPQPATTTPAEKGSK